MLYNPEIRPFLPANKLDKVDPLYSCTDAFHRDYLREPFRVDQGPFPFDNVIHMKDIMAKDVLPLFFSCILCVPFISLYSLAHTYDQVREASNKVIITAKGFQI